MRVKILEGGLAGRDRRQEITRPRNRALPWNRSPEDVCGPGLARGACATTVVEWRRDLRPRCAPIDRHPPHARGPIQTTLPFGFQDALTAGAHHYCGPLPAS